MKKENNIKTTPQIISEITESEMIFNIHQIQHILNGLINGKVYDGSELDTDKLVKYKLSLVKLLEK
jgi:hypothetical protein